MNYFMRFGLHNFLYNVAIGGFLSIFVVRILVGLLFGNFAAKGESVELMAVIVSNVLTFVIQLIVLFVSVKESAKYAAKNTFAPEPDSMKKFVTGYFGVLAVIQILFTIVRVFLWSLIGLYAVIGIITGLLVVGFTLYMIPRTMKVYDRV